MAATTVARKTTAKLNNADRYRIVTVNAGETILPGTMVALIAGLANVPESGDAGFCIGWADPDTTPADGVTSTTETSLGTGKIRVLEGEAWFENNESIAVSDIGAIAYAVNNQDINTTAASLQIAGTIADVDATKGVLVHFGLAHARAIS